MGFRELISETEAAAYAGVSQRTLRRFADSGYLCIEHDADGVVLFDREEVGVLFGVPSAKLAANSGGSSCIRTTGPVEPSPAAFSFSQSDKVIDLKLKSAVGLRSVNLPHEHTEQEPSRGEACDLLESEVQKLKHVLDVQERLLEERERELHQVMSERDWLRKRIEKLEEKSERDQILLLSETQTMRKLVNAQVQRRSPVRAMLEWFGFDTTGSNLPAVHR